MKKLITVFCLFVAVIFILNCGPPKEHLNIYQKEARYPQPPNFKVNEALIIRERNSSPHILATAFLIDKQKGLLASAKHFVGTEGDGQCKIFFNGKVYDGFLVRLPPITDIAVIKIGDNFDPRSFPEPYKIAHQISVGDKVFVRGMHPHPQKMIGKTEIIPIFEEYYGLIGKQDTIVYENLEAKISDLNNATENKERGDSSEVTAEISNNYINVKMAKDHIFTFGGLSGGPTVNERNELIGINSDQLRKDRKELGSYEFVKSKIKRIPFDELNLVPASELEKLLPQLADIR